MSSAKDGPWAGHGRRIQARPHRVRWWAVLAGALGLVFLVRVWVPFDEVFRNGAVVLAGNDAYARLFFVEQLLETGGSPVHPVDVAGMSETIRENDVMMIWTLWLFAWLFGGDVQAARLVFAWYPVVAALITAVLLYLLVVRLTGDRWTAVLAMVILALTPAHAFRTMLGFGDHHAFDYVALMLTATALAWLVSMETSDRRPWTRRDWWLVSGLSGGAVAAQSLGWRGGPMLFGPLVLYAIVGLALAVRAGRSPEFESSGLLFGLGIGSLLAALIHLGPNWAPAYRGFAPLLLFGLVVGLVAVAVVVDRLELPWWGILLVSPVIVGGWLESIWLIAPRLLGPLNRFRGFLESATLKQTWEIGEAASLIGSVRVPLLLFGLLLLVAVPVMVWGVVLVAREHRPAWVVGLAYGWFFLGLSVNRIRFTGFLAMFAAAFAAVGVVYLAERYFERRPTTPLETELAASSSWIAPEDRRALIQSGRVLGLVLLLLGLGLAQVPGTMGQITYDDSEYEVATWMAAYSDKRGWTYPENYVFSEWGSNRFYNYLVSGQSESYTYARQNYRTFVSSTDSAGWYEALAGGTGFIVIRSSSFAYPADSMQVRLAERFGSAGEGVAGLAHYRLVYRSDDGRFSVFTLVPGATIVGNASPGETVEVRTDVTVGETSFTYRRSARADDDGRFEVTVPYPGEYRVAGGDATVTERNVTSGETVRREST
jgi:dolichyl-diphosphooligosaccharide--protein glycosyltransferase